jgi:hypothetical protein
MPSLGHKKQSLDGSRYLASLQPKTTKIPRGYSALFPLMKGNTLKIKS